MPRKSTTKRAKKALRQGKKPSTAAGEFVREEFEHVRKGKHGASSKKQIVAIGLSKARRAGIPLGPAPGKKKKKRTQKKKRTHTKKKKRTQKKRRQRRTAKKR
jgi:hypothetical protein